MIQCFRALLRGAAAAALFACAGAWIPAALAAEAQPSASARQAMIEAAARLAGASAELSRIWPGYWPEDQSFIIQQPGQGALLVSPGPRPTGFEPMRDSDLPPALKGRAFFREGTLPNSSRPFTIGYPIAEGRTGVLLNFGGGAVEQVVGTILHEQFHGYQRSAFKGKSGGQFVDPLAIKDRVAFAAAAQVEQHVLAAALTAGTEAERRRLLKAYLALRREREASMPEDAIRVEQGFETSEGTALYVERLANARLFAGGEERVPLLLKQRLEVATDQQAPYMTQWFRLRGYATGAALTWLIGRYDKGNWRARIESGDKLDRMLGQLVGVPKPREARRLAAQARERFGYEARRMALEAPIREAEKREIKSVDQFLALAPYRLVLDLGPLGKEAQPGFSARNMTQLGLATTALPVAMLFSVTVPSASLTARERPVLMEGSERRYTVLLQALPNVGRAALAPGEHRLERVAIDADGVELKVERPVLVTVGASAVTVKLVG